MKKNYTRLFFLIALILFGVLSAFTSQAQFITEWQTATANESITIPTKGGGYNYTVDWGDGSAISTGQAGDATHTYAAAGNYSVSITGTFPRIYFVGDVSATNLIAISQWGTNAWTSMNYAFDDCQNLNITATDTPVLSGVTDLSYMFSGCIKLNPTGAAGTALNNWHTEGIISMAGMFYDAEAFNQNIGNWNTANVTNMGYMFYEAPFNQDIGKWNTANVTDMSNMFYVTHFNQDIGKWNTAKVTDMSGMFLSARAFNQDISHWNTANVTDMSNMFSNAIAFNQDIGNWSTAQVTDMSSMFFEATAFNHYIGNWNTANMTNMDGMFAVATAFNQDIGNWNTAKVTDMSYMFNDATAFNQDIGNWSTAQVTNMSLMFFEATAFNQDISHWNTANVTNMSNMFEDATAFNQDIGNWNTANITNMDGMFAVATAFNQDIGNWNTAKVTDMSYMFDDATAFNQDISHWNTVKVTNMSQMFFEATVFNQDIGNWNIAAVIYTVTNTGMENMLDYSGLSVANYDSTLIGWAAQAPQKNELLGAYNLKYCAGADARNTLITTYNWEFSGDALACALPLELISFTIQKSGTDAVQINWVSGFESGIATEFVQHSSDAENWETIYTQSPKGSNSKYMAYDENPVTGNNYYRLLTTDKDGNKKYSPVRLINFSNSFLPKIFPNPTTGPLRISNIKIGDVIILTDASGRQLLKQLATQETQMLNINSMAQGIYFISIIRSGKIVINDKITKLN